VISRLGSSRCPKTKRNEVSLRARFGALPALARLDGRSDLCTTDEKSRSSRPQRSPRELAAELEQWICVCRRKPGWRPRLVAGATGFAHSTRLEGAPRAGVPAEQVRVYEKLRTGIWVFASVFRRINAWPERDARRVLKFRLELDRDATRATAAPRGAGARADAPDPNFGDASFS
jgi:hypothetical protein